jgi:hypothetical protein
LPLHFSCQWACLASERNRAEATRGWNPHSLPGHPTLPHGAGCCLPRVRSTDLPEASLDVGTDGYRLRGSTSKLQVPNSRHAA